MEESYKNEIDRIRILSGLEPSKEKEEQINEGWLQNLAAAVGLLAATAGTAQTVEDLPYDEGTLNKIEVALDNPEIVEKLKEMGVEDNNIKRATKRFDKYKVDKMKTRKVTSDEELAKYLRMGYHLTGMETDTLIGVVPQVAPDSTVTETVLEFSDDAFFASGAFILEESEKQEIKQALESIDASGDVLLSVIVESSTDKQGLSKRLQKTLMSMGYTGDNEGLSQARNDAVMKILEEHGVDSSLIDQIVLAKRGEGIINPNTRYVKVRLQTLNIELPPAPGESEIVTTYPKTYELVKAFAKKKKIPKKSKGTCKQSVQKFKKGQILCPVF